MKKTLNLKLLKGLLASKISIEDLDFFKKELKELQKDISIIDEYLINPSNIPKLKKQRKNIIIFANKYKNLIKTLDANSILQYFVVSTDILYHWDDIYKEVLKDINDKTKALDLINILIENNYEDAFLVGKEEMKDIFKDKMFKNLEKNDNIEYWFSNGEKFYTAQYFKNNYPAIFENADIILSYIEGMSKEHKKTVYILNFNFDISSIEFPINSKEIVDEINKNIDKISDISLMCTYLKKLKANKKVLESNIKSLEKLVRLSEFKPIHQGDLENMQTRLKEIEELEIKTLNEYEKLGYNRNAIKIGIEYLETEESSKKC